MSSGFFDFGGFLFPPPCNGILTLLLIKTRFHIAIKLMRLTCSRQCPVIIISVEPHNKHARAEIMRK